MGFKIIRSFTIYQILFTFAGSLTFATYTLFLRRHGLSFLESNTVNMFFMLGITLFEIPTGMIGDYFGRKFSIVISCFLSALGFMVYGFSATFFWFVVSEIIIAIGRTFSSGSDIAWLKDSLDEINHDHNLEHLISVMKYKSSAMVIVGGVAGNYLYQYGINLPWFAAAILSLLAMVFVMIAFKERPRVFAEKEHRTFKKFWQSWTEAFKLLKENRSLQLLTALQFSWIFCMMAPNMTWAPMINENLGRPDLVKWFWMAIALAVTAGNYVSSRYARNGQSIKNVMRAQLITSIPLLAIFALSPITLVGILLINEFGRGLARAAIDSLPNQYIPASIRATTLSAISMFEHIGALLGLLLFGYLGDRLGIQMTWFIAGTLLLLAMLLYIPIFKNLKKV